MTSAPTSITFTGPVHATKSLPHKVTGRVLVAFIKDGTDGEVEWADILHTQNCDIAVDEYGASLTIEARLV